MLNSIDNAALAPAQPPYIDWASDSHYSIDLVKRALQSSCSTPTADIGNPSNDKVARLIIDPQQLNSIDTLSEKIIELQSANYFIICELCVATNTLQNSANQHAQLIDIFKDVDLIIAEQSSFEIINQITHSVTKSLDDTFKEINQLFSTQLALFNTQHQHWLYLADISCAKLAFNTQTLNYSDSTGALSATLACFMLQGKRSCDALVLALAYLQQNLSMRNTRKLDFSEAAQTLYPELFNWPVKLQDYPQVTTDICVDALKPFAKTDALALGLYPVVDSIEWLEKLLKLKVKTIQLRIKNTPESELDRLIAKASALGTKYQARLFINDYWQLAIKHQCYGVHLGQEDIGESNLLSIQQAGLKLGVSTHSEYEWLRAIAIKPSYIAMGTVYPTQTKPAILIGLNNLQRWNRTLQNHYPVVAIGGIKLSNIDEVLATGVGSIALVTAITLAADYITATHDLQQKMMSAN